MLDSYIEHIGVGGGVSMFIGRGWGDGSGMGSGDGNGWGSGESGGRSYGGGSGSLVNNHTEPWYTFNFVKLGRNTC